MLDELLLGGEVQESSKKNVLKAIAAQDLLQEVCCYIFIDIYSAYLFYYLYMTGFTLFLVITAKNLMTP